MNRIYNTIWNEARGTYVVAHEKNKAKGKAKGEKSLARRSLTAAVSALFMSGASLAADLPTGGRVVGGSGTISQSGNVMNINQATAKMAADWQSFSIGAGKTVNFVQPSSSSVAMNRVLGADVSVIQGALNANGQVFLINPNGVLFTPAAQVNVGGIVASTLNMSTADFMAGNYKFEGTSSNAIINQGNISAANGGTIALIAAKITNDGTLTANKGNVLLGAGSKVTLDMGGPVKLQIENDVLETLIKNGGAIKADGGTVWLTSQAATTLASSVINNTGVIEAQTLATGEKGEIILFAHGGEGYFAGTLDASAPNGGDGGFIETSAKTVSFGGSLKVSAAATNGMAGEWLIDPTDITIAQTSCTGTNCITADIIASTLNGGTDVTIETDAPVGDDYSQRGDINFNGNLNWNQSTLLLKAHNDIWIRGNLTGTGTAKLGLEYGLGEANGKFYNPTYTFTEDTTATYTILGSLTLPANSFYAHNDYDGTGSTIFGDFNRIPVFLNNGLLRFGDGTQDSVDEYGSLRQPFYYNSTDKRWYKLTYSDSPMYLNVAWSVPSAGDITEYGVSNYSGGTIISNQEGKYDFFDEDFDSNAGDYVTPTVVNETGYTGGSGTLVASNTISDAGVTVTLQSTYTLRAGASYIEAVSKVTNTSGVAIDNVRLWSGTRDDYIATTDGPLKEKGNIADGVFTPLTATGVSSNAIKVTSHNEGILFYSTSAGANTTVGECCDPDFHIDSAGTGSPLASPSDTQYVSPAFNNDYSDRAGAEGYLDYSEDGNYSVYSNFGSLANNAGKSIAWYYAAGQISNLASIVSSVVAAAEEAVAAIAAAEGAPTPTPTPTPSSVPQTTAITLAQVDISQQGSSRPNIITSGELEFVEVESNTQASGDAQGSDASSDVNVQIGDQDSNNGFVKVFVVNGGIHLPEQLFGNEEDDKKREN